MKKLIAYLIIFLLIPTWSYAATYYACIAGNIDAANAWEDAAACDGNTFTYGTAGFPAVGSVLEANNNAMVINTNPGPNGIVTLQNTAGAGFSVATNATPLTITANGTAIGAALLTITGDANANPALNIAGDTTWTGGNGSNEFAISDTHTVGTVVFGSAGHVVTVKGGTNSSAYGYVTTTVSPVTGYVAAIGVNAIGWRNGGEVAHTFSAGSSCTGGSVAADAAGCVASNSSANNYITLTGGNIVAGTKSVGAYGTIRYAPTTPANGVTGNYVKWDGGGTAVYMGTNTDDVSKALDTFYYIDPTDGTSDVGTATGGGSAYAY